VIDLKKGRLDARLLISFDLERCVAKPSMIAINLRLNDHNTEQRRPNNVHGMASESKTCGRY
jgi:hypothetical protein